jgi:hypothetical protein
MAIDTERETEPDATADGGLARLELPGREPRLDEEPEDDEQDTA